MVHTQKPKSPKAKFSLIPNINMTKWNIYLNVVIIFKTEIRSVAFKPDKRYIPKRQLITS